MTLLPVASSWSATVGKLAAWFVLNPVVLDSNKIMSTDNNNNKNCVICFVNMYKV